MSETDVIEYVECECKASEHRLVFTLYSDTDWAPELHINTFLQNDSFLKRILLGIKYIFGYKCKYGHFTETYISVEDVPKLINLLKQYREYVNEYKKNKKSS